MSQETTGASRTYQDIKVWVEGPVGYVFINRPEVMNAFRAKTCEELIHAIDAFAWTKEVGVIVLGGAGEKAFCTGGDQSAHEGSYDGRGTIGLPIEQLQSLIRDISKPVIARVQGFAIGGGNVLATVCDLTIASERAVFGQVGPKVGSVDAGFGTALLARCVGEKRAKEIWFLCRRYPAAQALEMGLVNAVVPHDQLDATVREWAEGIAAMSPTAIALAKTSFNAATEHIRGVSAMGMQALALYYQSAESQEGANAFKEKRKPDFRRYAR